jgi:hypothetical protein
MRVLWQASGPDLVLSRCGPGLFLWGEGGNRGKGKNIFGYG